MWDQCGGEGGNCKQVGACMDGPYPNTTCPAGSSCLKQSNYYYQCLPTGACLGGSLGWHIGVACWIPRCCCPARSWQGAH